MCIYIYIFLFMFIRDYMCVYVLLRVCVCLCCDAFSSCGVLADAYHVCATRWGRFLSLGGLSSVQVLGSRIRCLG